MNHTREITSLTKALAVVCVRVVEVKNNRHFRIKIQSEINSAMGNITISASPSDINVQRQRERQIRRELIRIGVLNTDDFCWR